MKKKFSYVLFTFALVLVLSACTDGISALKSSEEPIKDLQDDNIPIKEDYWHLACENTNVVLYKDYGVQGFEFELISAFPIKEEELDLKIETSDPSLSYQVSCYQQNVQEQEDEVCPFYIYQCYKGTDWIYMKDLGQGDNSSDDEFSKLQDMYLEEYQKALEQEKLPKLYSYMVGIKFDLAKMNSVVSIDAVSLTLREETKRYDLDSFILDAEEEFDFENAGILTTIGVFDAPIHVSLDGVIDLTEISLQPEESFTLTGLSFFKKDTEIISDCMVTLTKKDGTTTEMEWDTKEPIDVMKGESVSIQAYCNSAQLAGVMEANVTKDIMVHYESKDGTSYTEIMQGTYRMRAGMYDIYAIAGGANVLSYYLDYKLLTEDEETIYQ